MKGNYRRTQAPDRDQGCAGCADKVNGDDCQNAGDCGDRRAPADLRVRAEQIGADIAQEAEHHCGCDGDCIVLDYGRGAQRRHAIEVHSGHGSGRDACACQTKRAIRVQSQQQCCGDEASDRDKGGHDCATRVEDDFESGFVTEQRDEVGGPDPEAYNCAGGNRPQDLVAGHQCSLAAIVDDQGTTIAECQDEQGGKHVLPVMLRRYAVQHFVHLKVKILLRDFHADDYVTKKQTLLCQSGATLPVLEG